MKKTLLFLLVWLLIVNAFALIALNRLNVKGDTAYIWIDQTTMKQEHSWNPIPLHARWDSFWYVDIAKKGYRIEPGTTLANVVFFPLYPLLMRTVAPLLAGNLVLAGWLLSMAFLAGAAALFYRFVREFHPDIDPETPPFYLLLFPTAFFLNAVYTESLFLFLSLGAFYFARKDRTALAGIFGFLASLTRVTGALLFVPLVWEYIRQHGWKKILAPSFLSLLLIPMGTLSFFAYHAIRFGDPLLFFHIESAWGRAFALNAGHFVLFSHASVAHVALDVMFCVFALLLTYLAFHRGWTAYGLYMLTTVGVALSTGTLMSIGRYMLVLFPMYIVLATLKSRTIERAYIVASLLLLALNITLFVNWYWAG